MNSKEKFDVIIIGGGIAGLSLASFLSKNKKVCLLEAKKGILSFSFHTLGSFLDTKKYGLSSKVITQKITKVVFFSDDRRFEKEGKAKIIDKTQLHKEFLEKCTKNQVKIKTEVVIKTFNKSGDGNIESVTDESGKKYFAKVFVDCSGKNGILSKKLGLQDKELKTAIGLEYNCRYKGEEGTAFLFYGKDFKGGYAWIFPIQNKRAIVGFGSFDQNVKGRIKQTFESLIKKPPMSEIVEKDNETVFAGVIPVTAVKTKFVYKNLLAVGDSVSQLNPLVGEGNRFIIESAEIASEAILTYLKTKNLLDLQSYEKTWRRKYYGQFRKSKWLRQLAFWGSKSNLFSNILFGTLARKSPETFQKLLMGNIGWKELLFP